MEYIILAVLTGFLLGLLVFFLFSLFHEPYIYIVYNKICDNGVAVNIESIWMDHDTATARAEYMSEYTIIDWKVAAYKVRMDSEFYRWRSPHGEFD